MSTPKLRFKEFSGDWEVNKLGQVIDYTKKWSFTGGPFGSNLKAEDYTDNGVRIIQLQNIGDGVFNDDYKIYTSEEKANQLLSCNIYPNEIIISKMGDPVARCCIIPKSASRFLMASDGIRLVVDKVRFNNKFIHDIINAENFRKNALEVSTGSTRRRIGLDDLRQLPFTHPTLPEQTKIANFLTAVDDKITLLTKKADLLSQYKKGVMQQIFSQELRFKDDDGQEFPEWEEKMLGDIAKFNNGRAYKQSEWEESGTPVIRLQNLTGSGLDYYYSNLKLPSNQYCEKGDLLYMWSATFGPVWWFGDKAIYHYHIWKIETVPTQVSKNYFFYILYDFTAKMKSTSNGSTMLHITKGGIEKLTAKFPSLPEQNKIANFLTAIDEKITNNQTQLDAVKQYKHGLLQQMFV